MIKIELQKLLADRDGTLYWLSRETSIRWGTLAKMAAGEANRLELTALESICEALKCQPGDLLVRTGSRKARKKGK